MKTPKSWSDITIQQYYNLLEAIDLPLSDEDKSVAILGALTDTDMEYIKENVSIKDLTKALHSLSFISNTKSEGAVKPTMRIGGKKISFDLILRESSANSFISLTELNKTPELSKTNIHKVMAVFCYELNWWGKRKERTIKSQLELADFLLNNMTMNDAFRYRDFFLLSYQNLQKSTLDYLASKRMETLKTLKKVIAQTS